MLVTDLSVQDLLLSVAQRLNDLQDRVKQSEVTQPPRLIIKLLSLSFLGHTHKDVARFLLANQRADIRTSDNGRGRGQISAGSYLQQVVQRVLPGFCEELLLDADERSFSKTLETHHHP